MKKEREGGTDRQAGRQGQRQRQRHTRTRAHTHAQTRSSALPAIYRTVRAILSGFPPQK